ncbi:MAG: Flp pilus assembly protein CpaB [Candidatus Limnocylindrales bacterium]
MKRSNRLVLLIGIFLAIVAFVLVLFSLGGQSNQPTVVPTTVNVVIAAKDLPLGSKITADALGTKTIPIAERPADSYTDVSFVIGQTARQPVTTGQLLTSVILSGGGQVTTLDCPAGLVCIAVQVDQVSGVGTLTKPGDHVDMLVALTAEKFPVVTLNPTDQSVTVVSGLNSTSVKLLLQGMQVVGTLLPPPPADTGNNAQASPGSNGDQTSLNGQQQIVILAVTAQQSEVIKYAQVDGSISLVLRSADDFRDPLTGEPLPPETIVPVTTTGITLKSLVDDYGVLVPELVEAILPAQPSTKP